MAKRVAVKRNAPSAPIRGISTMETWDALCKDCRAEMATAERQRNAPQSSGRDPRKKDKDYKKARGEKNAPKVTAAFSYSGDWAERALEHGDSRSDRCPSCRRRHRKAISAYAVAYIDVVAIGEVADSDDPTGPLGGLGPLPVTHTAITTDVDLAPFQFGLRDEDIIDLLKGLEQKPEGSGDKTKRVAILEAGTGTGKSTFGPFRLMKPPPGAPLRLTEFGPIVVTEPRIPATTGVAQFVGEYLCFGHENCTDHIGPGFPVGYQISGDKNWDDACELIYVTDGTMINWVREGRLAKIGTVIVDEAHERSENIDLLLTLLRDQLPRLPHLRVIIASATIDKNFFIEYFGGPDAVHHQSVEAVKGVGYGVPLFPDIDITEQTLRNGLSEHPLIGSFDGWPEQGHEGEDVRAHTRELLALRTGEEIPVGEWQDRMAGAVADQVLKLLQETTTGDILAFLPKTDMIEEAVKLIRRGAASHGGGHLNVYPLLSTVDDRTKKKALAASSGDARKVVVSSNLAETSVTVSGVRYVVDSGLICQSEWDPDLAQGTLPTKPHSQAGVRQRWGRVGRDAPGWVFPLYTTAQFAEMPRNTPAGSTRTNLEQFLIKLKANGVDSHADVKLPGNFAHPGINVDADGKRTAETFSREIERATNALELNGAVDSDGHLTSLGRELDRFGGPAEYAIAIMFADRLACLTEVGVVLSLLGSGRLIGPGGLLRFNKDWPPSWRVHAAMCHRALAVGCKDDLDLALRIFDAWERSDDPAGWARIWSVNDEVLSTAREETQAQIGSLSAVMGEEARRPVALDLADRARAVLSRALASLTYTRRPDGAWQLETDPESSPVALGRWQLTPATDRVVALSRYRPPTRDFQEAPSAIIQGLVSVIPWARHELPDAFELLERAAAELPEIARSSEADPDGLAEMRMSFPVGSVVQAMKAAGPGSGGTVRRVKRIHDAPSVVDDLPNLDEEILDDEESVAITRSARRRGLRSSDDEAAFTLGSSRPDAETPDEELAARLVDVAQTETNDRPSQDIVNGIEREHGSLRSAQEVDAEEVAPAPERAVTWIGSAPKPRSNAFARVVGYGVNATGPVLELAMQSSDAAYRLDPPNVELGKEIEIVCRGVVSDHMHRFRVFELAEDAKCQFLIHESAGALDSRNRGFALTLDEGSTWKAVVVPGFGAKDPVSVTLSRDLHRQFAKLPSQPGARSGRRWYVATVVDVVELAPRLDDASGEADEDVELNAITPPSERPRRLQAMAQLDAPGHNVPQAFRFSIGPDLFIKAGVTAEVGARVEVRIDGDRSQRRARLKANVKGIDKILVDYADHLLIDPRTPSFIRPSDASLPLGVVNALLRIDPNRESWKRAVWRFWSDSLALRAFGVRPAGSHRAVEMSVAAATGLLKGGRRKELAEKHGVRIDIDPQTGKATIVGDPDPVAAAQEELATVASGPTLLITIPADRVGRLLRTEKTSNAKPMEIIRRMPGIIGCEISGTTVTLTGDSSKSVVPAIEMMRSLVGDAEGTVELSLAGYIRKVIVPGGDVLRGIKERSGCAWARGPEYGSASKTLSVGGPSRSHLQAFADAVRDIDPGATLTVTSERTLTVVDEKTGVEWLTPSGHQKAQRTVPKNTARVPKPSRTCEADSACRPSKTTPKNSLCRPSEAAPKGEIDHHRRRER